MDEMQLIERCIRGETAAQKRLYELHAPAMMSVCQRYVCCRETARDLLHDGFVKVFTKVHTYSGTGSFNGWMRRVFVTTALEYLRQKDVLRNSVEIEYSDYQETEQSISILEELSAKELLACIAALPEIFRTVFNMHAIEGYTLVEVARELEISDNTTRSRYARARKMLQKMIVNEEFRV